MKEKFNVLSLTAGVFKDNDGREVEYASITYVDKSVQDVVEDGDIRIGQQHVKMKLSTDNNNKLAKELAASGLVPSELVLDIEMSVVKNTPTLRAVGFQHSKA